MQSNSYLNAFYNNYDEDARLAPRHGSVEFLTTMHYIEKYIKTGDRIIEIGAGTGRYSHALARRGYVVQAVELVQDFMGLQVVVESLAACGAKRAIHPAT